MKGKWMAQVKGDPNGTSWEISVVREDNEHGRRSWGWFDEHKILVSHNGGHCQWPLPAGMGKLMVNLAETYAKVLNDGPDLTKVWVFQAPLYHPDCIRGIK